MFGKIMGYAYGSKKNLTENQKNHPLFDMLYCVKRYLR